MDKIEGFVEEWLMDNNTVISEHLDFFINKELFTYFDCVSIMNEIEDSLRKRNLSAKIFIRINCGTSKKFQKWGEQFWNLVDNSLEPPLVVLSESTVFDPNDPNNVMYQLTPRESYDNYVVFNEDEDVWSRYLYICESGGSHE